jgi:hypothetical protein
MPAYLADGWSLRELTHLRGYAVEWADESFFLLSQRNSLYRTASLDEPPKFVAAVPIPRWKSIVGALRPAQRALRLNFYNAIPLPSGSVFVTFARSLGVIDASGWYRPLAGLLRPTRVLRNAAALDDDGSVYFGEYVLNPERQEIRVYRLPPGSERLEVAHTFSAGEIRHVHGIYRDETDGALWCTAGDRGDECCIYRTADRFQTMEVVGHGDESWRTVSLRFTPRAVYYGMDAEFTQNFLFRVDRDSKVRTQLSELDGPVYYATSYRDWQFFGVTAELCPSQPRREGSLWAIAPDGNCQKVLVFKKDWYPLKLFQAGTWTFPSGPGSSQGVLFSTIGLQGADARVFLLQPPSI